MILDRPKFFELYSQLFGLLSKLNKPFSRGELFIASNDKLYLSRELIVKKNSLVFAEETVSCTRELLCKKMSMSIL